MAPPLNKRLAPPELALPSRALSATWSARRVCAQALVLFCSWFAVAGARAALAPPTLDEMAGDWLPMTAVANLPDVHNFNQMLVVNRDLTSYFCNPGGLYIGRDRLTNQWQEGYPLVKLTLDGVEHPAVDTRWSAYRALRRNLDCAGLAVETDTRMVNEQRGVLCRVTVSNPAKAARTVQLALRVPGQLDGDGPGVINPTQRPRVTSAVQPSRKPDETAVDGADVIWRWKLDLPAGGSASVGFAAGDEATEQAAATRQKTAGWAAHFDAQMDAFKKVWEQRWADAFTPGNAHFSGNLPILQTGDPALRRNYYMGALTMLILERTQFPIPRGFITSGERGDGIQYYWDSSMQAIAWALLEPASMKDTMRRWLAQNPRGGAHLSLREAKGYDTKVYDAISGYAFNATTIFQTADAYLRVTGDRAFLDEKVETGKTVLESMDALATDWQTLPKGPQGLINYGNNGKLLETAPSYIECVASLNAQGVWLLRQAAERQAFKGNAARAKELRDQAAAFAPTALGLYDSDSGAWNSYKVDGTRVLQRHCVDFIYVGAALTGDLSAAQKDAMIQFAKRELLDGDWMRAMSLQDVDASRGLMRLRPDHGTGGAYDGWIPLTVATMWRLGDPADAFAFYDRTAAVTKEGPFAQAHEYFGPHPEAHDAPVRVSLRGSNMKECISGASFADVVIGTFFGFLPSVDGKKLLVDEKTPRPFTGTLSNVRVGKALYTIAAGPTGVQAAVQPAGAR